MRCGGLKSALSVDIEQYWKDAVHFLHCCGNFDHNYMSDVIDSLNDNKVNFRLQKETYQQSLDDKSYVVSCTTHYTLISLPWTVIIAMQILVRIKIVLQTKKSSTSTYAANMKYRQLKKFYQIIFYVDINYYSIHVCAYIIQKIMFVCFVYRVAQRNNNTTMQLSSCWSPGFSFKCHLNPLCCTNGRSLCLQRLCCSKTKFHPFSPTAVRQKWLKSPRI